MAIVFRHGKGTRVLIDQYDMSPMLRGTSVSASMAPADVTTYQQNDHNYIVGLRDATVSFDGLFSNDSSTSLNRVIDAALGSTTLHVVTVGWDGSTAAGGRTRMFISNDTKQDLHSPVSDVVSLAVDMQCSSRVETGIWLRPLTAATATTANAGILNSGSTGVGGSTGGGVGHFHLVTQSTVTTIVAKIQHSTSGSTWADLIVFSNATHETFQRSTVSGTIKEQLRSNITTFTGGAGKTATMAVAFARHGKVI